MAGWRAGMRLAWRRVRSHGLLGWLRLERDAFRLVVKTALAATLAWWLAQSVLHSPIPALAGLAAVLTVQVTVKQTLARGLQQFIGVTIGVGATVLMARLLGVHTWSVGLVVFVGLLVGRVLRLGPQSNQAAISALLVLSLGSGYGWVRIVDTLLGAAVGVVVNMLIAPPTYVQAAGSTLRGLGEDLGQLLTEIGDGLAGTWDQKTARGWLERARDVDSELAEASQAVERGTESVTYNPLARSEAESVARLTEAYTALEHMASQVRGIARALHDLARTLGPDGVPHALSAYGDLLRQIGTAVAAFGRLQAQDPHSDRLRADWDELIRAHRAAAATREEVARRLATIPPDQADAARLAASILVDIDRMLREIDPVHGAHTGAVPAAAA